MVQDQEIREKTVCIVGLGYVGYPLAQAFSHHMKTIGFDIDAIKIGSIIANPANRILATSDSSAIREADIIIICVPTPVTRSKDPDLQPVISASEMVGKNIKKGVIVVLESTVYPGVTEEVVRPVLERESGLVCGKNFFVGYSPERINPGDDEHSLESITKIVAGMDQETLDILSSLYGLITNIYRAPDIKTAEAAKVIENIQRDINIALVNELSIIFDMMGISTSAVLEAAGTKWNFHPYHPGLVGGHCIPVDPYYLVYKAEELGYHPQVILAGRAINDHMPKRVAELTIKGLNEAGKVIKGSKVLIMGLTYKENVADTRESPATEIIKELHEYGVEVFGYDPLLTEDIIKQFGAVPGEIRGMDAVVITVAHEEFKSMNFKGIVDEMSKTPVIIDVRGMFAREVEGNHEIIFRTL